MITVGSIVIRVNDLERQTRFWEDALDYVRGIDREDDFVKLEPKDGNGPNISLDRVRSNVQIPPQIHLDLYATDQDAEVTRLLELGATGECRSECRFWIEEQVNVRCCCS